MAEGFGGVCTSIGRAYFVILYLMYLLFCSIFDDGGDAVAATGDIDCSSSSSGGCALLTMVAIRDTFHFDAFAIVAGPRETYNHRVFPLNKYSRCRKRNERVSVCVNERAALVAFM